MRMSEPISSKRQKIDSSQPSFKSGPSNSNHQHQHHHHHHATLFSPFRALGYISNHVPHLLQVQRGGKDAKEFNVNIVTCLGNSWAMWDAKKLNLLFLGPTLPDPITSMALSTSPDSILCASGSRIYRYVRGKQVSVYQQSNDGLPQLDDDEGDAFQEQSQPSSSTSSEENPLPLSQILILGDSLISISQDGSTLFIWSLLSNQLKKVHKFPQDFHASTILHPSTYLNKILIGSNQGKLILLNIEMMKVIYEFDHSEMILNGSTQAGLIDESEFQLEKRRFQSQEENQVHELLTSRNHLFDHRIVTMVQSPVIDVVAIGYQKGLVILHDLKKDESLFSLKIQGGLSHSTSSITFRTDNRLHTLAVSNRLGEIAIFDLDSELPDLNPSIPQEGGDQEEEAQAEIEIINSRRRRGVKLVQILRNCHSIPGEQEVITSLNFLPFHPLLISTSSDNSLKQWFFQGESSSSVPRLLKSRSGHKSAPEMICFFGEEGKQILSASSNGEFRCLALNKDSRSFELSQGSLEKRSKALSLSKEDLYLPKITSLSFSNTRSRDWDDILTTHENYSISKSWFLLNKRISKSFPSVNENGSMKENRNLIQNQVRATSSCVSPCGNFALVGNEIGTVEVYNLQSGIWRRCFDTREKITIKKKSNKGKDRILAQNGRKITGIVMDESNAFTIVATEQGKLFFFDFHTTEIVHTLKFPSSISSIVLHRPTSLLCLISSDLTLRLVDISTYQTVRHFHAFRSKILSATFSHDGRWLMASSLDGLIRTFDIPSSRLIDAFKTKSIPTCLAFSPNGDFLATTHLNEKGIFLWNNLSLFKNVALKGWSEEDLDTLLGLDADQAQLPSTNGDHVNEMLNQEDGEEEEEEEEFNQELIPDFYTPKQLHSHLKGDLITLTSLPQSRWNTLLNLDLIKLRNKPKEKPRVNKGEKTPFFLPQLDGVSGAFDVAHSEKERTPLGMQGQESGIEGKDQRIINGTAFLNVETDFERKLREAVERRNYDSFFTYLHSLPVPTLDSEIRSLTKLKSLSHFLKALSSRMKERKDFEGVQALLNVFLRLHGDLLIENGKKGAIRLRDYADQNAVHDDGDGDEMDVDQDQEEDQDLEEDERDGRILAESLREVIVQQHLQSQRLIEMLDYCLGTLAFTRNIPLT